MMRQQLQRSLVTTSATMRQASDVLAVVGIGGNPWIATRNIFVQSRQQHQRFRVVGRSVPASWRSNRRLISFYSVSFGSKSSHSSFQWTGNNRQIDRRWINTATSTAVKSATTNLLLDMHSDCNCFHWLRDSSLGGFLAVVVAVAACAGPLLGTATAATNAPTVSAACEVASNTTKDTSKEGPDEVHLTPSFVDREDFAKLQESHDIDSMPIYTSDQVAVNNGDDGKPVWMSYGGVVYDVTDFIVNHPGGSEKIIMAAGSAIEPFWYLYRQHFASDLPMRLMEHMAIGRLAEHDQDEIDAKMAILEEEDPYAREPQRHESLIVHSDTPMNAETPSRLLTQSYLTPNSLFYLRHHHPVPYLTEKQIMDYTLIVDLGDSAGHGADQDRIRQFTLDELKAMPRTEVTATLQCSGNRRSGFNTYQRTSGTPWGQGAISTAKFTGVRLQDVLVAAGVQDFIQAQEQDGIEHVVFHGLDGMMASIGIEKAVNPYGDVLICYEMNDEPLPRDHGFPLRVLVPGYAAVRNVKWLNRIELSKSEAEGPWQRGLNYKILPPSTTDAKGVDLSHMPSVTEASLYSGITNAQPAVDGSGAFNPGDRVVMQVSGWAWAGGGRNIVRVDVTGDDGKSWTSANLKEGSQQRFGRAWAWTFWQCNVPAVILEDGSVRLASKSVDLAFNVQPERSDHQWNVRGLGNNSWYKTQVRII